MKQKGKSCDLILLSEDVKIDTRSCKKIHEVNFGI